MFTFRRLPHLLAAGALAATLAACGGATTSAAESGDQEPADSDAVVAVQSASFGPDELTVDAGTEVTWQWDDGAGSHDVTGDGFASEVQDAGTFTHIFEEPGTYDYVCTLHDGMTGTITVESA